MPKPLRDTSNQRLIRDHIAAHGGPVLWAARFEIHERTAQRIFSGKSACPRAILATIMEEQADG